MICLPLLMYRTTNYISRDVKEIKITIGVTKIEFYKKKENRFYFQIK